MSRELIQKLLTGAARTYLRKIEVRGKPPRTAAIFAGNHPSGLIDPLVVMAAIPEKTFCSVAKASLFDAPVVSYFVKTMEAIPVAKAVDPDNPTKVLSKEERTAMNNAMFTATKERLLNNRSIVIFPEGTCHSTPELRSLKIGTAKMAFETACNDGPIVPVVPLGLSYSSPSGYAFRGSVLVDVGSPIMLTRDQISEYEVGSKQKKYELCAAVTDEIERRLRDCTIKTPNWTSVLTSLLESISLPPPDFKTIETSDTTSVSLSISHPNTQSPFNSSSVPTGPRTPEFLPQLKREVSRRAFFALNGADPAGSITDDRDFVEHMHLARRIYKPHKTKLSLAQYADMTRNFMRLSLNNSHTERFRDIWTDLTKFKAKLDELNLTDKYVSSHGKNTDPLNERLTKLRNGAKRDVAKLLFFAPLSLIGTVSHLPIIAIAWQAGRTLGTEKITHDISVVATIRLLAAFCGCCVAYPVASVAAASAHGPLASLAVVPFGAISAYAAVNYPVSQLVAVARGSFTILTKKDTVDGLRDTRLDLQKRIRAWADDEGEADMVGWWRDPEGSLEKLSEKQLRYEKQLLERDRLVKLSHLANSGMTEYNIPLSDKFKRQENERAVLSARQVAGNSKALVWIPGRNDSFFHVHVLQRFLDTGFDVFALDLRRCGRAKVDLKGSPTVASLLAHDSHDFREYFSELDATLKFLKSPSPLPPLDNLRLGGCGKNYEAIVCYAHSTGALVAGQYASDMGGGAWRGALDGFVFNSPFWRWNLKWYEKKAVQNAYKAGLPDEFLVDEGGGPSDYSLNMKRTYHFPQLLKDDRNLAISVGWCKAVTIAQNMLKGGEMVLGRPALVLSARADEVLDFEDIDKMSDYLLEEREDGKGNELSGDDMLCERVIESTVTELSGHDVLAADSAVKVNEAMEVIETWLSSRFV